MLFEGRLTTYSTPTTFTSIRYRAELPSIPSCVCLHLIECKSIIAAPVISRLFCINTWAVRYRCFFFQCVFNCAIWCWVRSVIWTCQSLFVQTAACYRMVHYIDFKNKYQELKAKRILWGSFLHCIFPMLIIKWLISWLACRSVVGMWHSSDMSVCIHVSVFPFSLLSSTERPWLSAGFKWFLIHGLHSNTSKLLLTW